MTKRSHHVTCPFCGSAARESAFLESERFRCIYNIAPILPGHCMIVPKKHIGSLIELSEKDFIDLFSLSKKVVRTLQKVFHTKAYDWTLQEGTAASQTIPHLHVHVVPRRMHDLPDPGDWYPRLEQWKNKHIDSAHRKRFTKQQLHSVVEHLRKSAK